MKTNIIPRILSIIVGIVFLFSGLMKLLDVSAFQSLIIQYGLSFFQYLAPLIILIEILLGLALILGVQQRITAIISICVLLIFTGAYTYGYLVNSVEDCGCFGSLVKSTPVITYIRNTVLIAILVIIICLDKNMFYTVPQWKVIIILSVMIPSVFAAGMTFSIKRHHNDSHPFEGMSLSETPLKKIIEPDGKRKLVFFISYQCQHCWNSIENYKAFVENGFVDTAICFALCNNIQSETDSIAFLFKESYPEVNSQEVIRDSVSFIEATPTAFLIEDDKVTKIVIGGLPSPFLLFKGRKTN
ncbi:MAG: DoxX family membrane protein [Bacteroidales bacterium]|nr:DoxX family membrane protein [Bacteroidales bacterium]